MFVRRPFGILLLVLLILVALIELSLVYNETLEFSEAWFLLLLVILGGLSLSTKSDHEAIPVLCLLLASVSVLKSTVDAGELLVWEGWLGHAAAFLWRGLTWLFPFVFVHFSLVFPVSGEWTRRHRFWPIVLYLPYTVLVLAGQSKAFEDLAGGPITLLFLIGFLTGLAALIWQYLYYVTPAEKNRLSLVLVGCLAGAVPRILSWLAADYLPFLAGQVSEALLTLFPVCLVVAVLKEDLSEAGKLFQRFLVYSLVGAGLVVGLFGASFAVAVLWPESSNSTVATLISWAVPIVLAYPLSRLASSYVSARFYRGSRRWGRTLDVPMPFRPIRPNPFIVGNPIRTPEMFFGRLEEFRSIRSTVRSQRQGSVIVLIGDRRTGKTSILYQILNGNLGEDYLPVFLDLQALVVESDAEFLGAIASRIEEAIRPEQGSGYQDLLRTSTAHFAFSSLLDSVIKKAGRRHLVLLLDEYELIEDKIDSGKLNPEIPDFLNSLLERHPRLTYILTGSNPFDAKPKWRSLLGKSFYREISFLERKDAEALIQKPLRDKVLFGSGAIEDLLRLTNGQPFFTQLLLQVLVEVLNEDEVALVDEGVLSRAISRVVEHPPPQLLYSWSSFSHPEKLVLASLATILKKPGSYVSSEKVGRVLGSLPKKHRAGMDLVQIRMVFENLRTKRVLDRDQTRYRFTMDLLRRWIQVEHNVWEVLGQRTG
jgi:hypothetical protein